MNENMSVYKPNWLEAKQRMTDWWAGKKVDRTVAGITAPRKIDAPRGYINKTPDKYTDPDTVFHNLDDQLERTYWGGEAFPFHFVYFGPMYGPMVYFGAKPFFTEATTWYDPCFHSLDELLAYEPDTSNPWWRLISEISGMSAERSQGKYLVTVGGISSIIDTLAGLIGNEPLLCALIDEPEKVKAARDKLIMLQAPTFDESYQAASACNSQGSIDWLSVWTPGKATTNQCDLCVMISPEMFDEFVLEDIKSTYDSIDHGLYHLDGEEQIMHLDSLLTIEKLHMIQWVPSTHPSDPFYTDPMNWINLFKRIQNAGKKAYIYTPHDRVKPLLNKIDRELVYLNVSCPDEAAAEQVLRDLEWR